MFGESSSVRPGKVGLRECLRRWKPGLRSWFGCVSIACCIVTCFGGCISPDSTTAQEPASDKTEAKDLAASVTGFVIWAQGPELQALELPTMKETVVRRIEVKEGETQPMFHAISGPDSSGRIAYLEDHFFFADKKDQKHLLKTIRIDGTGDTVIFSRPGNAMWARSGVGRGEIGSHLALAPTGRRVAILSGLADRQMPRALLHVGNIEIWDIEKKVQHKTTAKALNQPMSWFADGKRLAYVKLVPRDDLPKEAPGLAEFGKYFGETWSEVPSIDILDVESGKSEFLHVGWTPVVVSDGKNVLVGGWNSKAKFSWNRVRVDKRESAPIEWPGGAGAAVAVLAKNLVLFNGSAERGDRAMITIRLADLDSGKYQTLVAELERIAQVSFGQVLNCDHPPAK